MKKIIRLTESDLVRLVKRVIKEQETNTDSEGNEWVRDINICLSQSPSDIREILKGLYEMTNGFNASKLSNWDEEGITNSLLKIRDKRQYNQVNKSMYCVAGVNAHEPGGWGNIDFIKFILDESFMDIMDKANFQKVTRHFVKQRIIDRNSEYCKDEDYNTGWEDPNGIGRFCFDQK
jgi:hypothetical protein